MSALVCKEIKDNGLNVAFLTECIKSGVESAESNPAEVQVDLAVARDLLDFYEAVIPKLTGIAGKLFIFEPASQSDRSKKD